MAVLQLYSRTLDMDLPTADSPHVNELDTVPGVEEEEVESSPLASPRLQ